MPITAAVLYDVNKPYSINRGYKDIETDAVSRGVLGF